jgi:predicted nicotinamide N-methyase
VLEVGAGAGLPGILAVLKGAEFVVLSDYESQSLLENLKRNVLENIPEDLLDKVAVQGHIWGQDMTAITKYSQLTQNLIVDIDPHSPGSLRRIVFGCQSNIVH